MPPLWVAIHAALDARRDPFDQAPVREWLGENPADLEAVLRLRDGLRALARPQRPRARPLSIAAYAAACAALCALAAGLAAVLWLGPGSGAVVPRSEVLEFQISVCTNTPTTSTTTTRDARSIVRERTAKLDLPSGESSFATLTTTTRKEGL